MIFSCFRQYIALAGLALLPLVAARADSFEGPTRIDFNARGYATYNMWFSADLVVGGYSYASAYASFGGIYGSSYSYIGEAGVGMYLYNIQKVNGQWIAGSVTVYAFSNDTGQYEYTNYDNHPLPSAAWVEGDSQCDGYHQTVRGYIEGYGAPLNDPPVPSVSVAGRASGTTVTVNTVVNVVYSATDPNSNLSGIRYNISNSAGYFDNGGGSFVPQSGGSGTVIRSFTLSTPGTWYFWTEAQDSSGASASTPSGGSGYQIIVVAAPTWCTPAYEPGFWNNTTLVLRNNNCYNYANNRRTDTFAQPGRASGNPFTSLTGAAVSVSAISDGLEPTTAWGVSPTGKTKIALVIWPGWDYHWYRQDSNGRWTHKPGGSPARNTDDSGALIFNPEAANRGPYTQFIGYFFTPSDCVQGQGHANIY